MTAPASGRDRSADDLDGQRAQVGHATEEHPGPEHDQHDETGEEVSSRARRDGEEVSSAFERTIDEGRERLHRSWPSLLSTGGVGGLDVGVGVFALFLVEHETGSTLLGALAFSFGFIALSLANSELFTENFLVPITAAIAERPRPWLVVRLWIGTGVANLVGGWVLMALAMSGFPRLRGTALEFAEHYIRIGISGQAFAAAVLGGVAITLMTWMEHSTESVPAKLVAVVGAGFLLSAAPLNHAIVMSLELFAALQAGAPFGYLDWLGALGLATVGNMVGGIGLVTVLRLVQVGQRKVREEQERVDHGA